MRIDVKGNLYVAGPGGIWVFDPEGNHLGRFMTAEFPTNMAFAGPDFTDLYITGFTSVYRVRAVNAGFAVYPH